MKRIISLFLSIVIFASLLCVSALNVRADAFNGTASQHYLDIDHKAWYYPYAAELIDMGVMTGNGGNLFSPNATLTRAMLTTILYRRNIAFVVYGRLTDKDIDDPFIIADADSVELDRANGLCTVSDADGLIFSDVLSGKWYSEAVKWATARGIILGYPDGTFRPNAPVTREETMTVLTRWYELYADKYEPTSDSTVVYYQSPVDIGGVAAWARAAFDFGVASGALYTAPAEKCDGAMIKTVSYAFEPKREITRAECAKMLCKVAAALNDVVFSDDSELLNIKYIPY